MKKIKQPKLLGAGGTPLGTNYCVMQHVTHGILGRHLIINPLMSIDLINCLIDLNDKTLGSDKRRAEKFKEVIARINELILHLKLGFNIDYLSKTKPRSINQLLKLGLYINRASDEDIRNYIEDEWCRNTDKTVAGLAQRVLHWGGTSKVQLSDAEIDLLNRIPHNYNVRNYFILGLLRSKMS